jgi:hypothetical protein
MSKPTKINYRSNSATQTLTVGKSRRATHSKTSTGREEPKATPKSHIRSKGHKREETS